MHHEGARLSRQSPAGGRVVIWLLMAVWPHQALALDPDLGVHQYVIDSWGAEDGLPGNAIGSVVQTADNYIWISTSGGAVRYDGVRFAHPSDSLRQVLAPGAPQRMAQDQSGGLWFASEMDIGVARLRGGTVDVFGTDDGLPPFPAYDVFVTPDNVV